MPLADTVVRTGMTAAAIKQAVTDPLRYSIGCLPAVATPRDRGSIWSEG